MKAPKNFEALFLAAAVLLNVTAFATAEAPLVAAPAASSAASAPQVVVVKGHRLSAAEKAALN
ncbi:MAG: hypothetical protein V4484_05800 [Pseudomonadota bacterium]